jgi:sugar phosphate isomerase/epimerase|tara:strand:+ start:8554 stop:9321 length:768 start_codon:yes stop_codon:yes gene_type:complete
VLKTALQLYTVRNLPNGPETHFACAAEAGYTGVELLGDHGLESEAMSELLEKYGLEPTSSHVALDELESNTDRVVGFHREIGTKLLVVPFLPVELRGNDTASWQMIGRRLGLLGKTCREAGLNLGYHNHDFEMVSVGGATGLDIILSAAASEDLFLELDIAWAVRGNRDPLELLDRYRGRCPRVHVKDLNPDRPEEQGWADVGDGILDWDILLPATVEAGTEWLVVEHDSPLDPVRTANRSQAFLVSKGFGQNLI